MTTQNITTKCAQAHYAEIVKAQANENAGIILVMMVDEEDNKKEAWINGWERVAKQTQILKDKRDIKNDVAEATDLQLSNLIKQGRRMFQMGAVELITN